MVAAVADRCWWKARPPASRVRPAFLYRVRAGGRHRGDRARALRGAPLGWRSSATTLTTATGTGRGRLPPASTAASIR